MKYIIYKIYIYNNILTNISIDRDISVEVIQQRLILSIAYT